MCQVIKEFENIKNNEEIIPSSLFLIPVCCGLEVKG